MVKEPHCGSIPRCGMYVKNLATIGVVAPCGRLIGGSKFMKNLESACRAKRKSGEILIRRNVIDRRACKSLVAIYERHHRRATRFDYNGKPILNYHDLKSCSSKKTTTFLRKLAMHCRRQIERQVRGRNLFLESIWIARLGPGGLVIPHADNERKEGTSWVPNHTPQRHYTALLYLNETFKGGQLVFPDLDITIVPKLGLLVGFPSGHEFVHAVRKVRSGKRYNVAIWFTKRSKHALRV
jgi:hypothetical protein